MGLASHILTLLSLFLLIILVRPQVDPSQQLQFINRGEFGESTVEYGASYRDVGVIRNLFRLCLFNTTPNAFILAIGMGTGSSDSIIRWVWQANPQNPVQEEASLSFGPDGNLVLAQPDGRVVWQTKTENKGVIGLGMNENGNLELFDNGGWPVWQSFDFPTDTLLVGQSLTLDGPNKLVTHDKGSYSLILEPDRLVLSHEIPRSSNKSVVYYVMEGRFIPSTTFYAAKDQGTATQLGLATPALRPEFPYKHFLARPRFNASKSFLRLDSDGYLRIYTFDFKVSFLAWEVTFELFDQNNNCWLPSKCGEFGLCEDNQCVACPLEMGLLGWSEACRPKKVRSCDPKTFHYYRLGGVDHFITKYNVGLAVGESKCRGLCSRDCKCLGYFYDKSSFKCWIGYELGTLVKVSDSKKVAYIKTPNI
ncbi:hypothetical protein EUTSA_v10007731mg [Eutrema salsugineum]|uniref:Bulb-type lectin domain-containing protein n=1 Tax=Eutrema salsugineum TaxID=72664 RepID=V4KUX2_EUTSA|nr:EP1-like glycoprotein 4 [Eutrema salsugineum]ESQ35114.1 hypothetical protein EUTSA_v10007731mg [Eutrema salsugineum]